MSLDLYTPEALKGKSPEHLRGVLGDINDLLGDSAKLTVLQEQVKEHTGVEVPLSVLVRYLSQARVLIEQQLKYGPVNDNGDYSNDPDTQT